MVDYVDRVSQRLARDADAPLERPAQVQDRFGSPPQQQAHKGEHHRYGRVRGTKTGPNYFGDRTLVSASNATDKALLKEQRQSMLSLERCSPRMEATVLAIRGKSLRLRALLQNAANESLLSAVYDAIE